MLAPMGLDPVIFRDTVPEQMAGSAMTWLAFVRHDVVCVRAKSLWSGRLVLNRLLPYGR
jgi:hypothetical protein